MRIVLFGATGVIGSRIAEEALARGHRVTGVVRNPAAPQESQTNLRIVRGDATDPSSVESVVPGSDAVVSAISAKGSPSPQVLVDASRSLHDGMKRVGVRRLLVIGGAGSLEVAPGLLLLDSPQFVAAWKPVALAHYAALKSYRTMEDLDWTFLSPADRVEPATRTGRYRLGLDELVRDSEGKSFISVEDLAVAILDELEKPKHIRQRFTVAY